MVPGCWSPFWLGTKAWAGVAGVMASKSYGKLIKESNWAVVVY